MDPSDRACLPSGMEKPSRVKTSLFDYSLPPERIAKHPLSPRHASRMLTVKKNALLHQRVQDWPKELEPDSLVVVNDSRVLPARLIGRRASGGKTEIFLLREVSENTWLALVRPGRRVRPGTEVFVSSLKIRLLERRRDQFLVELSGPKPVSELIETLGQVPLPPYLRREPEAADKLRYQTTYAQRDGSVAAPTAGLHLSEWLLSELKRRGVKIAPLTLHVGLGTFRPVVSEDLDNHAMHEETFEVDDTLARAIAKARERRRPVIAVGTTVVRALESSADPNHPGLVKPTRRSTNLLIQPNYRFMVVDALLTNFHMPKSTLLALVSAFIGRERLLEAYREALNQNYRFLSYGDAMWLPERWL